MPRNSKPPCANNKEVNEEPQAVLRLIKTRSGAELLPILITKAEAARFLGVSTRMIDRWASSGELPQIRCGGITRYAYDDLVAFSSMYPMADGKKRSEAPQLTHKLIKTRSGAELLPILVTKAEAAQLLSVSTRTIERWVDAGELPQSGRGRIARFAYDDLIAFRERHRRRGRRHA